MTTNPRHQSTTTDANLYMSLELSASTWKLGFADQLGRSPRVRSIDAGDFTQLQAEISSARKIFGPEENAPVISCHEAGLDGQAG